MNHLDDVCVAIYCPDLYIQYGSVKLSGKRPTHTAVYTCNKGYKLVGGSKRTCLYHGVWDGKAPICKRNETLYYSMTRCIMPFFLLQQSTVLIICLTHNTVLWSCLATVLHTLLCIPATKGTSLLEIPIGYVSTPELGMEKHPFANVSDTLIIPIKVVILQQLLIIAIYCPDHLPNPQYGSVTLSGYSPSHTAVYTCKKGYRE